MNIATAFKRVFKRRVRDFDIDDILVPSEVKELIDTFLKSDARDTCEGLILVALMGSGEISYYHTSLDSIEQLGALSLASSVVYDDLRGSDCEG